MSTTTRSCAILAAVAAVAAAAISVPAHADETGLASMHAWRKERGITCMVEHFHFGTGSGRTKQVALKEAIRSWQEFTAFEYGLDWAYWRNAASKSVSYSESGTSFTANIEARPCNPRRR